MFERFTERARQVIVFAQEEARVFNHDHIGSEHILLGLVREEDGLAARVLASFDVTIERARREVEAVWPRGEAVSTGTLPFTPGGQKVPELALREALSLGHNYIGTEHLLLALMRWGRNETAATRLLTNLGLTEEAVRTATIRLLTGGQKRRTETVKSRTITSTATAAPFPARVDAATDLLAVTSMLDAASTLIRSTSEILDRLKRENQQDA